MLHFFLMNSLRDQITTREHFEMLMFHSFRSLCTCILRLLSSPTILPGNLSPRRAYLNICFIEMQRWEALYKGEKLSVTLHVPEEQIAERIEVYQPPQQAFTLEPRGKCLKAIVSFTNLDLLEQCPSYYRPNSCKLET